MRKPDIRIGTLVDAQGEDPAGYIHQILPHGFESFSLTFWGGIGNVDLEKLASEIGEVLSGSEAVISSLGIFGNPLEHKQDDLLVREAWEELIDKAELFDTDIVAGFTGRLRGKPIPDSLPRYREIFEPLAERAARNEVRLAFENCDMGGDWESGDFNIAHGPEAWRQMFDILPADNIGLEWEPCHQMVSLIDPLPQLREWIDKIFHLHGKCCTVKWDVIAKHGIHGPEKFAFHRFPGFGDCDWTDIFSELRWGDFTGAVDIEGWHDPVYRDELEMTGQVHALNYLKECRGGEFVPNPGKSAGQ